VLIVDALTYAGNRETLVDVAANPLQNFAECDIRDAEHLKSLFKVFDPDAVMHLAAESHVDRSISRPQAFIETNVNGTYTLLEAARMHWTFLPPERKASFRFHHVSTDEVYGSLGATGSFTEETPYDPRSPYSATKAASDHLVRAWYHTYGLPVLVTNCSNNFGPYQYPEKLIPQTILRALDGQPIPVYGDGSNVRDWLYVEDHANALFAVLKEGQVGETYNIGGDSERTNLEVVQEICKILDQTLDTVAGPVERRTASLITWVPDRPGHDFRYSIDASKIALRIGWRPQYSFEVALRKTVMWYIENQYGWCKTVLNKQGSGT